MHIQSRMSENILNSFPETLLLFPGRYQNVRTKRKWPIKCGSTDLQWTSDLSFKAIRHKSTKYKQVSDVHVTKHRDKFLIINQPDALISQIYFLLWNSTYFGHFLRLSSGVFHCTHRNVIRHTGLLTACEQEHLLLLVSCQQTCMT